MELRQLRYFVAVVEAGTVTGAAEQLAMSQPPLTMQLHNLEAELGCSLFAREGRRLRLTEAGAVFYRRAKTILALAEAAAGEMAGHGTGRLGTLRLGTISSVQGSMLPDWAAAFSARYPQVRLELHTADTYQQLEALRAGQIDVAVVRTPFSAPELEQLPLALERMLAAALPGRLPPRPRWRRCPTGLWCSTAGGNGCCKPNSRPPGRLWRSAAAATTPRPPWPWQPGAWASPWSRPRPCPIPPPWGWRPGSSTRLSWPPASWPSAGAGPFSPAPRPCSGTCWPNGRRTPPLQENRSRRGALYMRPCPAAATTRAAMSPYPVLGGYIIRPYGGNRRCTLSDRNHRRGAHRASVPSPRSHQGLEHNVPGHGGMWACRPTAWVGGAAGGVPRTRRLAGRCGHRPLRGGTIEPRRLYWLGWIRYNHPPP